MADRVLTITLNPSIDLGTTAKSVITDEKVRCTSPTTDPGGGGINVARVLSRLEIRCDALFVCGGYTGRLLKEMIAQEEVKGIPIETLDTTRQNISVLDESTLQQYRFVMPGIISDINTYQLVLDEIRQRIHQYDYIVASGSLPDGAPIDFYSRIGQIANNAEKHFILDTSSNALLHGLKHGAFCIKPNSEEFEQLKQKLNSLSDEDLYEALFEKSVRYIVHTKGKQRTQLISREGIREIIPPKIQVRSSVGAGDSFIGGMIGGLVKKYSMVQAVAYGISAAASTLQSEGTDLCDIDEVNQLFEANFSDWTCS